MFHGNIDDEFYGYGESKDGDESKAFMDGDGSLTKCPGRYRIGTTLQQYI